MATYTSYKGLEKPLSTEKYNVAVANKNNDVIDSELHKLDLKNQSQDNLLATKEALNAEILRAENKENEMVKNLSDEITRAKSAENGLSSDINNEINRATTAEMTINDNLSLLISELATRLNALADSDDTTLDQLSEIVAYIKSNRTLIESVTTNKVNVSDFDEHTNDTIAHTNSSERANFIDAYNKRHTHNNKSIIDEITSILIDNWNAAKTHADSAHARTDATKVEKSTTNGNILINGTETNVYTHPSGTNPHGTTKSDVGLGNVENKSSADIRGELTKEDVTTALGYTPSNTQTAQTLTGVKGDAETSYRTGDVNLTLQNICGDKVNIFTDNEGGNINLISPDGSLGIQMDLYNNNIFRIYLYKTNPWKYLGDISITKSGIFAINNMVSRSGITYSDSEPTKLVAGMTWIGN